MTTEKQNGHKKTQMQKDHRENHKETINVHSET